MEKFMKYSLSIQFIINLLWLLLFNDLTENAYQSNAKKFILWKSMKEGITFAMKINLSSSYNNRFSLVFFKIPHLKHFADWLMTE